MGVMDTMGAMRKAMQAQKQMKQIQAVGKNRYIGILMNGLSDIDEVEIDRDELKSTNFQGIEISDSQVDRLARDLEKTIKEAIKDAKKELEKVIRNSTNLDDLKGMLGM